MIKAIPQAIARKEGSLKTELFCFYGLLIAAVYFVYKKPSFALPFFLCLLAFAWFSKRNYFWIAFFFTVLEEPGYFFTFTQTSHLPFIKLLPGASLTPIDCFIVLMLTKAIIQRRQVNSYLKFPLLFLFIYCLFSFFRGIVFLNSSLDTIIWYIRPVVYIAWVIIGIAFLNNKEEIYKFIRLIFPIVFFLLFCQFYFLTKREELINLFDPSARQEIALNSLTGEIRAIIGGVHLVLLSFIGSLLMLSETEKIRKKKYLYLILILSFIIILISATRSWFAIFLFIFIGVYFKKVSYWPKIFLIVIVMLIILFAAVKFGVFSQEYLTESVWGRISQVFNFLGGNSRDIDTYMQRRVQLEFLLGKVSQELFFGYGFSDVSLNYYDTDLGFINTILMFGIFGFSLFLLLFFSYFKMMLSALSKTFSNKDSRDAIRVLIVSFLGILIFYCTTFDFFSFYQADRVAFVMIFLVISGIFAREATREIASKGDSYDKHSSGF